MQFFGKDYKATLKPVEDFLMKFNAKDAVKRDEPSAEKDERKSDEEKLRLQREEAAMITAMFADLVSRGEGEITYGDDNRPAA